ncbi:MAG: Ig-like domain repeat protein [Chloroflexi bacterium]|nr:Ig-like domain repeat protein [Chloroflexota bacterium]
MKIQRTAVSIALSLICITITLMAWGVRPTAAGSVPRIDRDSRPPLDRPASPFLLTVPSLEKNSCFSSQYRVTNMGGAAANTYQTFYDDSGSMLVTSPLIQIPAGETSTFDVSSNLPSAQDYFGYAVISSDQPITGTVLTFSISGKTVDGSSAPISGAQIGTQLGTLPATTHSAFSDLSGNYVLAGLPPGVCSIVAWKSGYTFSPASDSVAVPPNATGVNFIGTLAPTTTTTITSSFNPSVFGQGVSFTATVTGTGGTPTGTVVFKDGGADIAGCSSQSLNVTAQASCWTSSLAVGMHSITALYSGDASFSASAGVQTENVEKASTTTVISSHEPSPSVVGEVVIVTYMVAINVPGGGTPSGSVTVSDGISSCVGTIAAGSCAITFASTGGKVLTATYTGDGNFHGITSASVVHTVNMANTTTTITGPSPASSAVGRTVRVSYAVRADPPGSGSPSGSVSISDGVVGCSDVVAAGGCEITFTSVGRKTLTATYSGDDNFVDSASSMTYSVENLHLFLPFLIRWGPKAGLWRSSNRDEFYVSSDGTLVTSFSTYIDIPSCNLTNFKITHATPEPIINNHFSFSGSFHADVTFDSPTTAHGEDGLNSYTAPCGVSGSAGPWSFTAGWNTNAPSRLPSLPHLLLP